MINQDHNRDDRIPVVPQNVRAARMYYFLFLIRRTMLILIIVLLSHDSLFILKIILLFVLQTLCIAYAISIRSFDNKKDQVVEAFNECILVVLLIFMTKYDSEDKWNDTSSDAFIAIILFQSWTLLLISMGGTIIKIFSICKSCKKKRQQTYSEEPESENTSNVDLNQAQIVIDRDELNFLRQPTGRVVYHEILSEEESKIYKIDNEEEKVISQSRHNSINEINYKEESDKIQSENQSINQSIESHSQDMSININKIPLSITISEQASKNAYSRSSIESQIDDELIEIPFDFNSQAVSSSALESLIQEDSKNEELMNNTIT